MVRQAGMMDKNARNASQTDWFETVLRGRAATYELRRSVKTSTKLCPEVARGSTNRSKIHTWPGTSFFSNCLWEPLTTNFLLLRFKLQCKHFAIIFLAIFSIPRVKKNFYCIDFEGLLG